MQLTYRGITYTLNTPTVSPAVASASIPAAAMGQYRGVSYIIQQYDRPSTPQIAINLKYRGAYYQPVTPYCLRFTWFPA